MTRWAALVGLVAAVTCAAAGCARERGFKSCTPPDFASIDLDSAVTRYSRLSSLCLVDTDESGALVQHADALPYDLTTPLFSDYALKMRTVWMPAGGSAQYDATNVFALPVGSAITKTFAWAEDLRRPTENVHLIETRLLVHTRAGWIAFAYVWDDAGGEATIDIAGRITTFDFLTTDGETRTSRYLVPSSAQCGQCHEVDKVLTPIGPKARLLNRDQTYADGTVDNQLARWARLGKLSGAPATPADAPRLAAFDNPATGTVETRARAWLETNCMHCHQAGGQARTAGLFLAANETDPTRYGVCKLPIAAGPATGGRLYDIVPGKPDESIVVYRIESTNPSTMMPELGRSMVHAEGVALVRDWIAAMPATPCQ